MLTDILKYIGKDEGSRSRAADLLAFLRDLDDDLAGLSGAEVETGRHSSRYSSVGKTHETSDIESESSASISESDYGDTKRADQSGRTQTHESDEGLKVRDP